MDRRFHVGLGIADDRPPRAGVNRDVVASGKPQRVEDDVGDLLDRASRTDHGGYALEPEVWIRRGKQHGENVVAGRIHVEDYAFHGGFLHEGCLPPGSVFLSADSSFCIDASVSMMIFGRAR